MSCRLTTNRPQNTEIQRRVGRRARSLRSAETGIYKKFLSNRSGTRPDGTPDAGISPVPQSPAAFAHHAPRASGFRPHLLPNMRKNFTIGLTKLLKHYKIEVL